MDCNNNELTDKPVPSFYYIIKTFVYVIFEHFGMYLFWIILNFLTINIYPLLCAPPSMMGFLMSPLMVLTPQCQAAIWVINTSNMILKNMWILLGTHLSIKLTKNLIAD